MPPSAFDESGPATAPGCARRDRCDAAENRDTDDESEWTKLLDQLTPVGLPDTLLKILIAALFKALIDAGRRVYDRSKSSFKTQDPTSDQAESTEIHTMTSDAFDRVLSEGSGLDVTLPDEPRNNDLLSIPVMHDLHPETVAQVRAAAEDGLWDVLHRQEGLQDPSLMTRPIVEGFDQLVYRTVEQRSDGLGAARQVNGWQRGRLPPGRLPLQVELPSGHDEEEDAEEPGDDRYAVTPVQEDPQNDHC